MGRGSCMMNKTIGHGTWYDKTAREVIEREQRLGRNLDMIRTEMGFGASEVFDPLAQVEIPLMGEFLNIIAMLVFITTLGMQKFFLVGVQRSFEALRAVDLVTHRDAIMQLLISGLAGLFTQALTISFPILGTLLLVSIVMGLLAKAAPQMDVLSMGFPLSIGVAFIVLLGTLPFLMTTMERIIDGSFQTLSGFINGAGSVAR